MRFVRALLLIACLALVALSHAPVSSNALLTDSEAVGGNVFTTGYWALIGELVGGDGHTCAVKATGDVWCWGRGGRRC